MATQTQRDYQARWRAANRQKCRSAFQKHYERNRPAILEKQRLRRVRDHKKIAERNHIYNQRIRREVLVHYSAGQMRCACCGEATEKFLSLDHINGNGASHRRELAKRGWAIYLWLRSNDFPSGFQVLCYNCNCAKGFYGHCPHKEGVPSPLTK